MFLVQPLTLCQRGGCAEQVDDARAATEHVRAAGYEVTMEPKEVQLDSLNVTIAFFTGPSGESVEFVQTH